MRSINDDSVMVIQMSDMDLNIGVCSAVNLLILIEDHGISHTWSTQGFLPHGVASQAVACSQGAVSGPSRLLLSTYPQPFQLQGAVLCRLSMKH